MTLGANIGADATVLFSLTVVLNSDSRDYRHLGDGRRSFPFACTKPLQRLGVRQMTETGPGGISRKDCDTNEPPWRLMSKNIIICSDGTGNTAIKNRGTNVFKLFEAVDLNGHRTDPNLTPQIALYDDGVGTDAAELLAGQAQATDLDRLDHVLRQNPQWNLEGLCTHFQSGSDITAANSRSHEQLKKLEAVTKKLQRPQAIVHVLNSSAALALAEEKNGAIHWGFRPGISLYGADPQGEAEMKLGLKPVLSWVSKVSVVHQLLPGESVSYNATWTAKQPSTIAVLPVGYADGYARMNSNKAHVLCRGFKAPVVGTVCMDAMMVDLTEVEQKTGSIQPGEPIVLLGEQGQNHLSATELAGFAETISYEVLTRIGERVPRVYNDIK